MIFGMKHEISLSVFNISNTNHSVWTSVTNNGGHRSRSVNLRLSNTGKDAALDLIVACEKKGELDLMLLVHSSVHCAYVTLSYLRLGVRWVDYGL